MCVVGTYGFSGCTTSETPSAVHARPAIAGPVHRSGNQRSRQAETAGGRVEPQRIQVHGVGVLQLCADQPDWVIAHQRRELGVIAQSSAPLRGGERHLVLILRVALAEGIGQRPQPNTGEHPPI